MKKSLLQIIIISLVAGGWLHAADVSVPADADLYTTSAKPSGSFKPGEVLKTTDRIVVGGGQTGYVHFSVPKDIPNADAIKKAVFRLYLPFDDKNSQNVIQIEVCTLLNGENHWDDAGNPSIGTVFLPKTGAMDPVMAKVQGDKTHSDNYVEWDVTGLVKEKGAGLDDHAISFRITMKGGVFRFNDREGNLVAGYPPQLVITQ